MGMAVVPFVKASDQPIDLDKNAANGAESKVSTKVLQTYPVKIENTVNNNAAGPFTVRWVGAGPGGFITNVPAGPGVGAKWVWTTVYQVYSIDSPAEFTPARAVSVTGAPPKGVGTVGSTASTGGSYVVPGKSIYPSQVTVSDASLSSSLITFFSPEKTVATCAVQCAPGECELSLQNLTGGEFTMTAEQLGCCLEPHQLICDDECTSYLTDTQNCGECGNVCASDEICSNGACVCPPGLSQCGSGCIDLQTSPEDCGACGNACASDENCTGGDCLCDPGLTQCGAGCVDLQTSEIDCGACGNACGPDQFCGAGACICNPGLTQCGAGCVDLTTSEVDCGSCGNACATNQVCNGGSCVCDAGLSMCGGTCLDLANDPLNCGSCGFRCEANDICTGGICKACRPPRGTACGNQCVNTHTDPNNCGGCGEVCDFSGCPSSGQGTCSQGDSCVCAPSATTSSNIATRVRFKPVPTGTSKSELRVTGRATKAEAARSKKRGGVPTSPEPAMTVPATGTVAASPLPVSRVTADLAGTSVANQVHAVTGSASSFHPNEAPVCDLAPIEQVIPAGGTYTQMQTGGRFGKEIQTSVSIMVDGRPIATGPCPQIVPVTGVDTSGIILSTTAVVTRDTSGDGLCQPGEARCEFFISVAGLGDTPCLNPVATLASPPDQFNPNDITLLNATSAYPSFPAYPGDGVPLDKKTNTTAFAITTPFTQASDVGRPFTMSVACSNHPTPVLMPINLGIGGACNPASIDLKSYDQLVGFQGPVNAALVPVGSPVNYSTRKFNKGSTIPLKVALICGGQTLTDVRLDPNPMIVALEHETLGPQSLIGINGDNNANPDDPGFSCSDTACDYQFRTDNLPVGRYIIRVQMPDTRVFQAGLTISP